MTLGQLELFDVIGGGAIRPAPESSCARENASSRDYSPPPESLTRVNLSSRESSREDIAPPPLNSCAREFAKGIPPGAERLLKALVQGGLPQEALGVAAGLVLLLDEPEEQAP